MKENKVIKNYLNNLNESSFVIKGTLYAIVPLLIFAIIFIISSFSISKRDKKIEKQIKDITGLDFQVYVFDIGKETHAYSFGGITGKNLFLSKSTIKKLTEREIIAVCIHEISHSINIDGIKKLCATFGLSISSFYLIEKFIKVVDRSKFLMIKNEFSLVYLLILIVLVFSVFLYGSTLVLNKMSRKAELKADLLTIKYGYEKDLISALKKLEPEEIKKKRLEEKKEKNKFTETIEKISSLNNSHPDIEERINKLLEQKKLHDSINSRNKYAIAKTIKEFILQEN